MSELREEGITISEREEADGKFLWSLSTHLKYQNQKDNPRKLKSRLILSFNHHYLLLLSEQKRKVICNPGFSILYCCESGF